MAGVRCAHRPRPLPAYRSPPKQRLKLPTSDWTHTNTVKSSPRKTAGNQQNQPFERPRPSFLTRFHDPGGRISSARYATKRHGSITHGTRRARCAVWPPLGNQQPPDCVARWSYPVAQRTRQRLALAENLTFSGNNGITGVYGDWENLLGGQV